jgi:hypothetical protein
MKMSCDTYKLAIYIYMISITLYLHSALTFVFGGGRRQWRLMVFSMSHILSFSSTLSLRKLKSHYS